MIEIKTYTLEQFIANLHNFTPIPAYHDEKTWADKPLCVAAVCAAKISELASVDSFQSDPVSSNMILEHGAIQKLLENLNCVHEDVKQSSAVALDQLIRPKLYSRIALIDNEETLNNLKNKLKHPKEGMRFTIASILHTYYTTSKGNRERILYFKSGKLVSVLINLTVKYEKLNYINRHLLNLRDLATTSKGVLLRANLEVLKDHGIVEMLDSVKAHTMKLVLSNPTKIAQIGISKFIAEAITTFRRELTEVRLERNSV